MRNPFRFLTRDWPWKLFALVLALILFVSVRKAFSYTQTVTLPVEAVSLGGAKALTGFVPSVVSVTFRGSESAVRRLSLPRATQPKLRVNLDQPPAGTSALRVRLTPSDIETENDLRVVSIEPSTVIATFDVSDTQILPVAEPVVKGVPDSVSVRLSYSPRTVSVTGSKARLAALLKEGAKLTTPIVDLSTKSENFHTALKVVPPDSKGGWTITPSTVQVDVQFTREDVERVIRNVPVRIMQSELPEIHYASEVDRVDVTLHGTRREVDAVDADAVSVAVRELRAGSLYNGGRQRVVPEVILPYSNRVERVTVSPPEFFIRPTR